MRDIGAVDCWIEGCDWFVNQPADVKWTFDERDAVTVKHLWETHTVRQIAQEIDRRVEEVGPYPHHNDLTQEQVEDRNSILRILNNTMMAAEKFEP